MAAGNTYVALSTQTLSSAVSSVTFNSIPQGYTDLVLISQPLKTASGGGTMRIQLNGDTGANYSSTTMAQENNSTWSDKSSGSVFGRIGFWNGNSVGNNVLAHFQNYSNSTTYKTFLVRTGNASAITGALVNRWGSTSAITSIYIYNDGGNFDTGSTFSLYGILAA